MFLSLSTGTHYDHLYRLPGSRLFIFPRLLGRKSEKGSRDNSRMLLLSISKIKKVHYLNVSNFNFRTIILRSKASPMRCGGVW